MGQHPRRRRRRAPLSRLTRAPPGCRYRVGMEPRIDVITASRVDLALTLLPAITWLEASCMLARSRVPADVAARVLVLPGARRRVDYSADAGTSSPYSHMR